MVGKAKTKCIAVALLLLVGLVYIKRYSRIIQVVMGTPGLLLLVRLVYIKRCSRTIQVVRGDTCFHPSSWTGIYQEIIIDNTGCEGEHLLYSF